MSDDFREQALHYHAYPTPGKIEIALTKPANTRSEERRVGKECRL